MKKFVVATFLTSALSMAFVSCDNGQYDSDPKDNNAGLNPLNPSSGVDLFLGHMRADLNGTTTAFYPSYYIKDAESNSRMIHGMRAQDPLRYELQIGFLDFKNAKEFTPYIAIGYPDPERQDSISMYAPKPGDKVDISLAGEENGNIRGTFSATLYKMIPKENLKDYIIVKNGEFYVPEKK